MPHRAVLVRAAAAASLSLACLIASCSAPPGQEGGAAAANAGGGALLHRGNVLYWGSVAFVTCASSWSCDAPADECAVTCRDGSLKKPLMHCDLNCIEAVQQCDTDGSVFFAAPSAMCGRNVTMCWGGRKVAGRVRDLSDARAWEMNEGARAALGAPGGTVQGASLYDGDPCGNGRCDASCGETCETCAVDCGTCGGAGSRPAGCGDGWCDRDGGEDCLTCARDCPSCQEQCCGERHCGASVDGSPACAGYSCGTCRPDFDCDEGWCVQTHVWVCGDGQCRGESCEGCPVDCCPRRACADDPECPEGEFCDVSNGLCCLGTWEEPAWCHPR